MFYSLSGSPGRALGHIGLFLIRDYPKVVAVLFVRISWIVYSCYKALRG
nr:MAG: hypothetical protein H1BulkLitter61586_000001 [Mitovirus sp.]